MYYPAHGFSSYLRAYREVFIIKILMSVITEKEKTKNCLSFLNILSCKGSEGCGEAGSKFMCVRTLKKEKSEENTMNCMSSTTSAISPSDVTKRGVLGTSENQVPSSLFLREPETLSYDPEAIPNSVPS